ncbi:MAG: hypothetical protein KDK51_02405 [Deltaproteobacteria bacterium]|nr:hypothetical protein [Deltaproteobacteria bacterium]
MSKLEKTRKEQLIGLVRAHYLFQDQYKESYIWIRDDTQNQVKKIISQDFYTWLGDQYFLACNDYPSFDNIKDASRCIDGRARCGNAETFALSTRCSHEHESIYVDLGQASGRVIQINGFGWSNEIPSKPIFRRFQHQKPLPPVHPLSKNARSYSQSQKGLLAKLKTWIPIKSDGDLLLLLAWVVATIVSKKSKPILCFVGPKGSGKSTSSAIVKNILDPSENERSMIFDEKDFAMSLSQNGIVLLDNLTGLSKKQAHILCMAATSGSFQKRSLYTDEDMKTYKFTGSVILNGIHTLTKQPDLLDRMLTIELTTLLPHERLKEQEIWDDFQMFHSEVLGLIFDKCSQVMKMELGFQAQGSYRLQDFGEIGERVAVAFGFEQMDFVKAYQDKQALQQSDIYEDPLFQVLCEMVSEREEFRVTSTDLLRKVLAHQPDLVESYPYNLNSSQIGRFLNEHHHAFLEKGIRISRQAGRGKGRIIVLSAINGASSASSVENLNDISTSSYLPKDSKDAGDSKKVYMET